MARGGPPTKDHGIAAGIRSERPCRGGRAITETRLHDASADVISAGTTCHVELRGDDPPRATVPRAALVARSDDLAILVEARDHEAATDRGPRELVRRGLGDTGPIAALAGRIDEARARPAARRQILGVRLGRMRGDERAQRRIVLRSGGGGEPTGGDLREPRRVRILRRDRPVDPRLCGGAIRGSVGRARELRAGDECDPHGATRTEDYDRLAAQLTSPLPEALVDFFHVKRQPV